MKRPVPRSSILIGTLFSIVALVVGTLLPVCIFGADTADAAGMGGAPLARFGPSAVAALDTGASSTDDDGSTAPDFTDLAVERYNIADRFGGGSFIGLLNPDRDSMIGVLYGTEEHPNYIHVISMFTRYLGVADVQSPSGASLGMNTPLPLKTLIAQRLGPLYEFDDGNNDGLLDTRRAPTPPGPPPPDPDHAPLELVETVFKRVNLYTGWTASAIQTDANTPTAKEWSFSLTAEDQPYVWPRGATGADPNDTLDEVQFTFHLSADRVTVESQSVPVYDIVVDRDRFHRPMITAAERAGNRTATGEKIETTVKYDHWISGWDYADANRNRSLYLSSDLIMANAASSWGGDWLGPELWRRIEGDGAVEFRGPRGRERRRPADATIEIDDTPPELAENISEPEPVLANELAFVDNWQQIARFHWVSTVTVDGEDTNMSYQTMGTGRYQGFMVGSGVLEGMAVIGGFVYPGGDEIYHDPGLSSEALSFEIVGSAENDPTGLFAQPMVRIFLAIAAVATIVVVATVAVVARTKPALELAPLPGTDRELTDELLDESFIESYYWDGDER